MSRVVQVQVLVQIAGILVSGDNDEIWTKMFNGNLYYSNYDQLSTVKEHRQ